ncbi:ATP-binding protein [Streptomyces sp. NPDC057280]|uniref:ATP-binding protein n=1 Tax=Streptomyces sp. NPDC057280 TaxID=3346081 RepID=UPI003627E870
MTASPSTPEGPCQTPTRAIAGAQLGLSTAQALVTYVPPSLGEASRVRKQLRAACAEGDLPLSEAELDRLESCTAEILANAVVHAQTMSRVTVRWTGAAVRVETTDANQQALPRTSPSEHDESGRGLLMVQEMASRWGVEHTGVGKTVWFEIDHPSDGETARGHEDRPDETRSRL